MNEKMEKMKMSKPFIHAQNSVKRYGGIPEDYLPVHDFFDQTKAHFPTLQHRAILHSSFGIFLCEQVFGHNIKNSEGKLISSRALGEDHVMEDLGFIPTVADYLSFMSFEPWMRGQGLPPSMIQNKEKEVTKTPFKEMVVDGASTFRKQFERKLVD